MTHSKLNILIADDHSIIQQGLGFLVEEVSPNSNIFFASTISEVFETIKNNSIDFLILDLSFTDESSLHSLASIKEIANSISILIFTAQDEDLYAVRCFKEGASGFLNKSANEEEIIEALKIFFETKKFISQEINDKIFVSYLKGNQNNPINVLTNRELEIALHFVNGLGNLEIENLLNLKKSTISTFKNKIFTKLDISNISQLIHLFQLYKI